LHHKLIEQLANIKSMRIQRKTILSKIILIVFFSLSYLVNFGQDIKQARKNIEMLSSKDFSGRAYTNNGDKKAAEFILNKLKKFKLKPFEGGFEQAFNISINTFPGDLKLSINGSLLLAGSDYLVNSTSCSIEGTYPVIKMNHQLIDYLENFKKISKEQLSRSFLLIDTLNVKNQGFKDAISDIVNSNMFGAKGIIEIERKSLMYSPSPIEFPFPRLSILKDAIPENIDSITLTIKNQYLEKYTTQNIIAFAPGAIDTFIVFTAHYDHIGQMGKDVYFPGANDNASGVALVLDLARYYAQNLKKLKYSMAFIFFSGEEIGLLGSKYYAQNPLFPLSKVKFLVNLDMVGSGDKGIKVVNGTVFKSEFDKLVEFNKVNNYLSKVSIRGPAANSDHYPFYNKGVKSFFIYTEGDYSEYHSVYDKAKGLPLVEYEDLYRLLVDFVHSFN